MMSHSLNAAYLSKTDTGESTRKYTKKKLILAAEENNTNFCVNCFRYGDKQKYNIHTKYYCTSSTSSPDLSRKYFKNNCLEYISHERNMNFFKIK